MLLVGKMCVKVVHGWDHFCEVGVGFGEVESRMLEDLDMVKSQRTPGLELLSCDSM